MQSGRGELTGGVTGESPGSDPSADDPGGVLADGYDFNSTLTSTATEATDNNDPLDMSLSRSMMRRFRTTSRQMSTNTKKYIGVGEDDDEYRDISHHWAEKQKSVYSKYKAFLFGELKEPENHADLTYDYLTNHMQSPDNEVLASMPARVQTLASPDAFAGLASSYGGRSGLGSDDVFLDGTPRGTRRRTVSSGYRAQRFNSTCSTKSGSTHIQRLPSVSKIGKDIFHRAVNKSKGGDIVEKYMMDQHHMAHNFIESCHNLTPSNEFGGPSLEWSFSGGQSSPPNHINLAHFVPQEETVMEEPTPDPSPARKSPRPRPPSLPRLLDPPSPISPKEPLRHSYSNHETHGSPTKKSSAGSNLDDSRIQQLRQTMPAAGARGARLYRPQLSPNSRKKLDLPVVRETENGKIKFINAKTRRLDSHVRDQIAGIHLHRPYFTVWVSLVQFVVLTVSLVQHGFGPVGFGMSETADLVSRKTLDKQQVSFSEPENFWIGPRPANLIKMGAKYTPCMSHVSKVAANELAMREAEVDSGCCVMMLPSTSDMHSSPGGYYCYQSSRVDCQNKLSVVGFFRHEHSPGPVCGLDPEYCELPSPVSHPWPHNVTQWPICKKPVQSSSDFLMTCHITGRPCCYGVRGLCIIATRDYCQFLHGVFHEKAFLCSQVSCMSTTCGLLPFREQHRPDQLYRLLLSMFVHAGIVQLGISLILQLTLVRWVEILCGPVRTGAIYLLSGFSGNLVSAILLPYQAQVGPYACLFGILGCYVVELYQMHELLVKPLRSWCMWCTIFAVLFVLGLLPWLDNFMNFFGLLFGILLSLVLMPYITLRKRDRVIKLVISSAALVLYISINVLLLFIFFVYPVELPKWLLRFTCIPITPSFCSQIETRVLTG